jgi:hypothetical protein
MMRAPRRASCRCCAGIWNARVDAQDDEAQLEQIVVAQRERAKTVQGNGGQQRVLLPAPAAYDEKAVRKHVTAEMLAAAGRPHEELGCLAEWTAPGHS